jgi:hypothetical protein
MGSFDVTGFVIFTRPAGAQEFAMGREFNGKGRLFVTNSRLIMWFPFDSQGIAMGSRKFEGAIRVGHVRYEWASEISFATKAMGARANQIRVGYMEPGGDFSRITVILARGLDADRIAGNAVSKAVRYRLAMRDPKPAGLEDALRAVQAAPDIPLMTYHLPGAYPAGEGADWRPGGAVVAQPVAPVAIAVFDPSQGEDAARRLLEDPARDPADLAAIAAAFPSLTPQIASHPRLYPELRAWLAALNRVDVNAALAANPGRAAS